MLGRRRDLLIRLAARLYQNDAGQARQRPLVKVANKRITDINKRRLDYQVEPKLEQYDPKRTFKPFPFAVNEENKFDVVRRLITPLHDVPYDEQLRSKESYCRNALRLISQELYRDGTPIRMNVQRLPCLVNPVVPSPVINGYRNKNELSIWYGHDGKTLTAGYMVFPIGKHGDTICIEPGDDCTLSRESIRLTEIIQEFIRNRQDIPICFSLGTDGGWRRFIIRVNLDGDLMLVGHVNPRGFKVKQVLEERDRFRDFMVRRCQEVGLKLASLYYQPCPHNSCSHDQVPYECLHGATRLTERIGKFEFQVSPESFLHPNTKAAEVMYDVVRKTMEECFKLSESNIKPLVIDTYCGAGALSLNLAELAGRVIGLSKSGQSIVDADSNGRLNQVENVEFINSQFEIVFERLMEKYSKQFSETILVADVPKTGLHRHVIECIRESRDIQRMIYIAPRLDGTHIRNNLIELCSKRFSRSAPFAPVQATPVDICPHIEFFPTVIALERLPERA